MHSKLYRIGAICSMLQLTLIVAYMIVTFTVGPRVNSAEAFFQAQQANFWTSLLRLDLMMMLLVGLYLGNFPALLVNLWKQNPLLSFFAFGFTIIAVTLSFAGEATFALLHLGEKFIHASTDVERSQLIAAGESLIASGWWNSTGSYVTGILLQVGGIMISMAMLSSGNFHKTTAIAGIVGNSFDLTQHLLSPFLPGITAYLSIGMVGYLIWYPMMSYDLLHLARETNPSQ
ncbi:MAG: hypothetical protein HN995_06165 [Candidatus Marinimicrobia bacterium]|jgi:hypothetical protein|nr:hypothetical protein [Candidatus Neomarinimicrobiota bacterium]MBT3679348.1 hypothetical protein [Candidatus Neomarinimicrobiota bacterium]MBT3951183.1 hypothetical protein [Candidatus Neomarinimicrobiota bacterium]MBT4254137.1 hypothetical protein [Candidatus Neomarinimicrobiota bacterium]MBT4479981.1 hypothetical protein [Candidatus Neomarinimicrobiota bacterium]